MYMMNTQISILLLRNAPYLGEPTVKQQRKRRRGGTPVVKVLFSVKEVFSIDYQ